MKWILCLMISMMIGICCDGAVYEEHDDATLKRCISFANRSNDKKAQCCCGMLHEKREEYLDAFYWYIKSAKQGDITAQFRVGYLYLEGKGVEKDIEKAVYWLETSTAAGSSLASDYLASLYLIEKGDHLLAYSYLLISEFFKKKDLKEILDREQIFSIRNSLGKTLKSIDFVKEQMTKAEVEESQELARRWLRYNGFE